MSENAVLFMAYGACQRTVAFVTGTHDVSALSPLQNACAGSVGGVACSFVLCPTELIKCKQQAMRENIQAGRITGVSMKDV